MNERRKDNLLNDWAPGSIFGRLFFAVAEEVSSEPEPSRLTYVGPNDPRLGTLQIVREGTERTLCDLPIQRDYWRTQENIAGRVVCLQCKRFAAELLKTA